uniref:Uncharacterized protein n=1 Tax=Anguilla anguilla TaxID=7936 RepID=A0A0E9TDA4_ANGAN
MHAYECQWTTEKHAYEFVHCRLPPHTSAVCQCLTNVRNGGRKQIFPFAGKMAGSIRTDILSYLSAQKCQIAHYLPNTSRHEARRG